MRNLIAISLFLLAVVAVAITVPLVRSCHALPPQNEEIGRDGIFSLVVIGKIVDRNRATLIYAIKKGDLSVQEKMAFYWGGKLGSYGMNATIYISLAGNKWKAETYKRPKNTKEALEWLEEKSRFYSEKKISSSDLPAPAGFLSEEYLRKVEFVIRYLDGGMKMYLRKGTTEKEARELLSLLANYV